MTQCTPTRFDFHELGRRGVVASFVGGNVTSDAGGLLLREVEVKFGFITQFARCFTDYRDPECIEHTLEELLKQRIFGLCLGYEDLNDHDQLRHDPLLAVLVGKKDPLGQDRLGGNKGKALAGKSTLNRLELTPVRANASSFTLASPDNGWFRCCSGSGQHYFLAVDCTSMQPHSLKSRGIGTSIGICPGDLAEIGRLRPRLRRSDRRADRPVPTSV
jgi:hypothetical protein